MLLVIGGLDIQHGACGEVVVFHELRGACTDFRVGVLGECGEQVRGVACVIVVAVSVRAKQLQRVLAFLRMLALECAFDEPSCYAVIEEVVDAGESQERVEESPSRCGVALDGVVEQRGRLVREHQCAERLVSRADFVLVFFVLETDEERVDAGSCERLGFMDLLCEVLGPEGVGCGGEFVERFEHDLVRVAVEVVVVEESAQPVVREEVDEVCVVLGDDFRRVYGREGFEPLSEHCGGSRARAWHAYR